VPVILENPAQSVVTVEELVKITECVCMRVFVCVCAGVQAGSTLFSLRHKINVYAMSLYQFRFVAVTLPSVI